MADATVKVFDSAGMPYQHTLTDASRRYTITDLPEGTYTVAAAKEGYLLSPASGVALSAGSTQDVPLLLTPEPTLSLGAIAGVLSVLQPEQEPAFSFFFPYCPHLFFVSSPGPGLSGAGTGDKAGLHRPVSASWRTHRPCFFPSKSPPHLYPGAFFASGFFWFILTIIENLPKNNPF